MRRIIWVVGLTVWAFGVHASPAWARPPKPLQIYSIDVEGGQATLIVTPSRQSVLVDTGWPDFDDRDADRIVAAAKRAGVKRLDYVVITHYHRDHVGGVEQLAAKIKIGAFVDHGPNQEDSDDTRANYAAYERVAARERRITLKPDDGLPLKGVTFRSTDRSGRAPERPFTRSGRSESLLHGRARSASRRNGECTVTRYIGDVWAFPLSRSRRSHEEERAGVGLSQQYAGHGRFVPGDASRVRAVERQGDRLGSASASRDYEQWRPQGREPGGVADRARLAWARGPLATALRRRQRAQCGRGIYCEC